MKRFKENDIYALEIKNISEEYNGRYIIIMKASVDEWNPTTNRHLFRFKITRDKKLPTIDEINDLEYIITHVQHEYEKYFPKNSSFGTFYHQMEIMDKMIVYPDKYDYIYSYVSEIFFITKGFPTDLIYIGNINCDLPEKEYIPLCEYGHSYTRGTWENIISDLIKLYEDYNLKKSRIFTIEFSEANRKGLEKMMKAEIYFDKLDEIGITQKLIEMLPEEKSKRGRLTYVGGEDKDPYRKNGKSKKTSK